MPPEESGGRVDGNTRTLLLALLVLALLAGPLWVEVLHLNDPTYRYERAEVTVVTGTIEYASEIDDPAVAISDDILCTDPVSTRACALERTLVDGGSVPADVYHRGPGTPDVFEEDYEYVATRGGIYRPTAVTNRSQAYVIENGGARRVENGTAGEDAFYRVELTLERADAPAALEDVSVPIDSVGPVTREAATSGSATTHRDIDIPETPVRLEDGTYYRVYLNEKRGPPATVGTAVFLLRFGAPLAGLVLAWRVWDRFEVRYVGPD